MSNTQNAAQNGIGRRLVKAVGWLAISCIYTPAVLAGDAAFSQLSPLNKSYDFSRWDMPPLSAPSDVMAVPQFHNKTAKPAPTSFSLSLQGLLATPEHQLSFSPHMSMTEDASTTDQDLSGGAGFLSGGDVSTMLFYTAGAAIGVIGSNLKEDEKLDAMSGATDTWGKNFTQGDLYKNVKDNALAQSQEFYGKKFLFY